jgi:hypothetical protein
MSTRALITENSNQRCLRRPEGGLSKMEETDMQLLNGVFPGFFPKSEVRLMIGAEEICFLTKEACGEILEIDCEMREDSLF